MFGFGKKDHAYKTAEAFLAAAEADIAAKTVAAFFAELEEMDNSQDVAGAYAAAKKEIMTSLFKFIDALDAGGASRPAVAYSVCNLTAQIFGCICRAYKMPKEMAVQLLLASMDAAKEVSGG